MRKQGADGRFVQQRVPWTPERWDDGYIDNKGRFRVYRPDYPHAYALGYALRAHVVWWLAKGEAHPAGTDLHHDNENKLDDAISNLKLLSHGGHGRLHNPRMMLVCKQCGVEFPLPHKKTSKRRRFCKMQCYDDWRRAA